MYFIYCAFTNFLLHILMCFIIGVIFRGTEGDRAILDGTRVDH